MLYYVFDLPCNYRFDAYHGISLRGPPTTEASTVDRRTESTSLFVGKHKYIM